MPTQEMPPAMAALHERVQEETAALHEQVRSRTMTAAMTAVRKRVRDGEVGVHQVPMEFAYDGGGVGKGGAATLYVYGQPVRAAKYTLTFDLDDLPPVTELWELPLYDEGGYFVDNEPDRYAINSHVLERGDLHLADGKLVISI